MKTLNHFLRFFQFFHFPFLIFVTKSLDLYRLQTQHVEPFARDFTPLLKKVIVDIGLIPFSWLFFVFLLDYLVFFKKRVLFLLPLWLWQLYTSLPLIIVKGSSPLSLLDSPPFEFCSLVLSALWLILTPSLFFQKQPQAKSLPLNAKA